MTYINSVRAAGVDPLLVSGGDFLFALKDYKQRGNRYYRQQMQAKAQLIAHAYNIFGYDAAAVGECELALGIECLREIEAKMKFPLLCANLVKEDGTLLFAPSTIVKKGDVKIGIVAVLMDTLSASFLDNTVPGAKVQPPVEACAAEVAKIRDQVDVMLVLGHVNRNNVERIVAEIPGVDFVLEANSYLGNAVIWITEGQHFMESNGKVLLKMDGQGSHIGRVDLLSIAGPGKAWTTAADAGDEKSRYVGQDISIGPHWGQHAGMEKMVKQYQRNTRRFVETALDTTFKPSDDYLTLETCAGCHVEQTEFWRKSGHARAYATLEKTGDEFRYDCMPCHVLGYGETFINAHEVGGFKDVQCESCHGTNPRHPDDPERYQWPKVDDKKCWGCHNPMETKVNFDPKVAIPQIACPKLER